MLYIVHVNVEAGRAEPWLKWMLDHHIQEVVDTGYFQSAVLARVPESDTDGTIAYRAIYHAHSPEALDAYQANDAPRLKADHIDRFGEFVSASREILPVLGAFSPSE